MWLFVLVCLGASSHTCMAWHAQLPCVKAIHPATCLRLVGMTCAAFCCRIKRTSNCFSSSLWLVISPFCPRVPGDGESLGSRKMKMVIRTVLNVTISPRVLVLMKLPGSRTAKSHTTVLTAPYPVARAPPIILLFILLSEELHNTMTSYRCGSGTHGFRVCFSMPTVVVQ